MHRFLIFSVVAVFLVSALPRPSEAEGFLSVIDDLPLMVGLTELTDEAVSFETAEGRIATASATGHVTAASITGFYRSTLPQIGWRAIEANLYVRDQEVLKIEVQEIGSGRVQASFSVSPKPQ